MRFLLALTSGKTKGWFAVSISKITSFSAWTLVMSIFIGSNTLNRIFKDMHKTINIVREPRILLQMNLVNYLRLKLVTWAILSWHFYRRWKMTTAFKSEIKLVMLLQLFMNQNFDKLINMIGKKLLKYQHQCLLSI